MTHNISVTRDGRFWRAVCSCGATTLCQSSACAARAALKVAHQWRELKARKQDDAQ